MRCLWRRKILGNSTEDLIRTFWEIFESPILIEHASVAFNRLARKTHAPADWLYDYAIYY